VSEKFSLVVQVFVLVEHLAGSGLGDGVPALPGDVEDEGGDEEADDRVGPVQAEGNDRGASRSTAAGIELPGAVPSRVRDTPLGHP
jgi:hypothetical protein